MGFLNGFFGGKKSIQSSLPDGKWLENERDSIWKPVLSFKIPTGMQVLEVAFESCYMTSDNRVYCILRNIDKDKSFIAYFCGIMSGEDNGTEIQLLVDRIEDLKGNTIKRDNWVGPLSALSHREDFDVMSAIKLIRNHASFNHYSIMPPYAFMVEMNTKKT